MSEIKKTEDVLAEINELVQRVIGKINSLDSRNDRASVCETVLTSVIAGTELSRIEKVGILFGLTSARVRS